MARPSLTWMGMMRVRGFPEEGKEIDGCGGIVQRPTKTAWSASQRNRPSEARVDAKSLYHSYEDCFKLYKATKSQRMVAGSASGKPGICFTKMLYGRRA